MSQPKEVTLSRSELYNLVWSKPMCALAKEFGISDVALAKWCRKMDVPRPGVGHWRKLETGKRVSRPELPNPTVEKSLHIRPRGPEVPRPKDAAEPPEIPPYEVLESDLDNRIQVPDGVSRSHPLVEKTRRALERGYQDSRYGWVRPSEGRCLDILTSPGAQDRALRIMDALLKALDRRGSMVEVIDERYGKGTTFALVDGERIGFGIFESPQKAIRTDHWSGKPVEGMVPSGRLVLRVRSEFGGDQCQFRDLKRTRIEDRLNDFIVALHREAKDRRAQRIAREKQHLEWERRRKEQEALECQRRAEEACIQKLHGQVLAWVTARDIRAFLVAAEHLHEVLDVSDPAFEDWRSWAEAHAEALDPLRNSPDSKPPWAVEEPATANVPDRDRR